MNEKQRKNLLNPSVGWFTVSQSLLTSPYFLEIPRELLAEAVYIFFAGMSYAMDQMNPEVRMSHLVNGPGARLSAQAVERAAHELIRVGIWRVVEKDPLIFDTGAGWQIEKRLEKARKSSEASSKRWEREKAAAQVETPQGSEYIEDPFG